MRNRVRTTMIIFMCLTTNSPIVAQFSGGSADGFDIYSMTSLSNLNGETIFNEAKYTGGDHDGYDLLTGIIMQLDGQKTSLSKHFGSFNDGFDGYTVSSLTDLNGVINLNAAKYQGGDFDGYYLLTGVITRLDGQQMTLAKFSGGGNDGFNIFGTDQTNLDGGIWLVATKYFGGNYDGYVMAESEGERDVSLPVTLALFALAEIPTETAVKVEWQTESEIENAYWLLFRRMENDSVFATIQKIEGQGNSSVISEYAYQDSEVEAGMNYTYQLADVSINGQIAYHDEKSIAVSIPKSFELFQNYPNPFNPSTNIKFALPQPALVRINIYNILGQKIIDLINEQKKAGYHMVNWKGTNSHGNTVSSGFYIYLLQAEGISNSQNEQFQKVKKMLLVR